MKIFLILAVLIIALTLSNVYGQQDDTAINENPAKGKIKVVASFYPFYEFVKEIAGTNIVLKSVIPFGFEPHDWEISPQKVSDLMEADMIIYSGIGFDAWLGDKQFGNSTLVDVSKDLKLIRIDQDLSENSRNDERKYGYDSHIWLDPILVKNISKTISDALIKIDPNNTDAYLQNTENFNQQLDVLDSLIKTSLTHCELKDFITFHQAFQYFANRYGLNQHAVHEGSQEGEILPQQIIKIISLAKDLGIDTIYSEELKDPRLSQTLASEIPNGKVLLLSPIEGIDQQEQKKDIGYIEKMKMNLENLKQGLKCK